MDSNVPSNIQDLKLGISQTELIAKTKAHIDALYDENTEQNEAISAAQAKADDAYNLASQKHKIVAYDDLSTMISALNSANKDEFNIGDEIYIKDILYTRDFWVSAKQDTPYPTQTDEDGFTADEFDKGYVGYFELSILDERPEVTNMVTSDDNITEDKIVLGAGNKKVKSSDYLITSTLDNSDNTVPTNKAVFGAIEAKATSIAQSLSKRIGDIENGTTTVGKATTAIQDENGYNIVEHYATKSEVATAGEVKAVKLNGISVVDSDKNANINIRVNGNDVTVDEDEKGKFINIVAQAESTETSTLEATLTPVQKSELEDYPYNAVDYKAIKLEAKVVVTGVYNSKKQSIITQPIVATESDVNYIYYLVATSGTEEDEYYYQTIDGNVVGGGGESGGNVLYEHHITFTSTPIEISSISLGMNSYNRTAYVSHAKVVSLLDSDEVTKETLVELGHSNGNKIIIHGYVTVQIADFENYSTICPIVSIEKKKARGVYVVTFVESKFSETTNWITTELVSFDIPYDSISIHFDLVTPIITK